MALPRRPKRKKRRWNSLAMKSSFAPTKWSTSTTSRLPAMAPLVAKITARPAATSTRATRNTPTPMIVLAIVEGRAGDVALQGLPQRTEIGLRVFLDLDHDQARNRQILEIEAGAEPGLEQALGFLFG